MKSCSTAKTVSPAWVRHGRGRHRPELVNAGKAPVTRRAYFHHADSFAMMRGGHLDICIMGGMQSPPTATWPTGRSAARSARRGRRHGSRGRRPARVHHDGTQQQDGAPKLLRRCTPLTGAGVVSRVYTDLAVFDVTPGGLRVRDMIDGLTLEELQRRTEAPLLVA